MYLLGDRAGEHRAKDGVSCNRMPSIAGCTASSMMQAGIFAGKTTAPVADSALNFAPIPTPSAAPADPIVERDEREVDSETDPRNDDACSDDDDDDLDDYDHDSDDELLPV